MTKNIAVFVDGTGNAASKKGTDNTNVLLMSKMVLAQPDQRCIYIAGIGTETTDSWWPLTRMRVGVRNRVDRVFGLGATLRVQQSYKFLAEQYENNDRVFLFGFSRGAFIVRTLAGFINRVGLLFKSAAVQHYVEYAFYLYWKDDGGERFGRFLQRIEKRASIPYEGIDTHFLGQWDTVEALFEPSLVDDTEAQLRAIAEREKAQPLPTWIKRASHALALHDLRSGFAPLLWSGTSDHTQVLNQVWFAGAHADVGGGYETYPAPGKKFSDITLEWMRKHATAAGLKLVEWHAPASHAKDFTPHLTHPFYELLGPMQVREELHQPPAQATVLDASVLKRLLQHPSTLYDTLDRSVRLKWIAADAAAMQLYYRQWYPKRPPFRALSPITFQAQRDRLDEAILGKRRTSLRKVIDALSLIAIFDRGFLYKGLPEKVPSGVFNWLRTAARSLENELREPAMMEADPEYARVDKLLLHYIMEHQLPHKKDKTKRHKL